MTYVLPLLVFACLVGAWMELRGRRKARRALYLVREDDALRLPGRPEER